MEGSINQRRQRGQRVGFRAQQHRVAERLSFSQTRGVGLAFVMDTVGLAQKKSIRQGPPSGCRSSLSQQRENPVDSRMGSPHCRGPAVLHIQSRVIPPQKAGVNSRLSHACFSLSVAAIVPSRASCRPRRTTATRRCDPDPLSSAHGDCNAMHTSRVTSRVSWASGSRPRSAGFDP